MFGSIEFIDEILHTFKYFWQVFNSNKETHIDLRLLIRTFLLFLMKTIDNHVIW